MPVLRIRGVALPSGDAVDLYTDGDRWIADPVAGAELVGEGWVLPGLVDAHTHPGAEGPGKPLEESLLREDLHQHVAAGGHDDPGTRPGRGSSQLVRAR
jgi:cytosine/adenosine deaminase-related metal-dependent hydrolase